VISPVGVIRPMMPTCSVNHKLPSAPSAIPLLKEENEGGLNNVITPDGVTRPTFVYWVNHRFPSEPAVIPAVPDAPGIVNSVTV